MWSRRALLTCCAPPAIISADFAVVSVLAPQIRTDLGLGPAEVAWLVAGFSAGYGAVLVAAGGWADQHGRRRALLAGLVAFAAGAVAVSVATSAAIVISARVVQGIGAAVMLPAGLSLLTGTAASSEARGRATGAYGLALAVGFVAGTLAGGALATLASWRLGMGLTVSVCVAAAASARRIPDACATARPVSGRVGLAIGCVVCAGTLGPAIAGWVGVAIPAAATAALLAFGGRLGRATAGRAGPAVVACAASAAIAGTGVAALLFLTLLLQDDRGYTPLATGAVFTCFGAAAVPAAGAARRLCATRSARAAVVAGLAVQGAALLTVAAPSDVLIVVCVAGFGFGHVLGSAAAASLALEGAPGGTHGALMGTVGAAQRLGAALGPILAARLASTELRTGIALSGATAVAAAALIGLASRHER